MANYCVIVTADRPVAAEIVIAAPTEEEAIALVTAMAHNGQITWEDDSVDLTTLAIDSIELTTSADWEEKHG